MKQIITKIKNNGIENHYSSDLKQRIEIANIFNIIFIFLVFPFVFIFASSKAYKIAIITCLPIVLHLLSFILIKLKFNKIGRLIFSLTTSTSVYFVAALVYKDSGTDGMAAKFLILGTSILPFVVFQFKDKSYLIFATLLNLFYLITFNYLNNLLTLNEINSNLDSPLLRNISLLTAFFMFASISFYFIKNIEEYKLEIEKQNKSLKEMNDELRTAEEELRQQNEQMQITNKNLREKENKITAITNGIFDAVIMVGNSGNIEFWNKGATRIFGYTRNEILGKDLHSTLAPEKYRETADKAFSYFMETGKGNALNKNVELEAVRKNGETFPVMLSIVPLRIDNEWQAVGIVKDITQRKKAEQELIQNKKEIENLYKNLSDSINYAKNIQDALLTRRMLLDNYLSPENYFIIFKPKEIVGGDFYYVNKIKNYLIFGVADCTGHGVPGAFITILAITYLHDIVRRPETINPAHALNNLRSRFKDTFKSFGAQNNNGLDIALCALNTETCILQYAGAYSPLWIIRGNEFIEIKASRNPIGYYPVEKSFKNNEIKLQDDDKIYLFSDGFKDQLGGKDNKTFSNKKFRELLIDISPYPMDEQKKILENTLTEWQGQNEQTDDITILGLKFCIK